MKNTIDTSRGPKTMECIERGFKALDLLPQLINQMEKELDQSATHNGLNNCELIARAKELVDA